MERGSVIDAHEEYLSNIHLATKIRMCNYRFPYLGGFKAPERNYERERREDEQNERWNTDLKTTALDQQRVLGLSFFHIRLIYNAVICGKVYWSSSQSRLHELKRALDVNYGVKVDRVKISI